MREATCSGCGLTAPIGSFYSIRDKLFCEPCSWKEERAATARGEKLEKISVVDGSVCARCNTRADATGSADWPVFKGASLCPNCQQQIQNWPYPGWLKASLAGLLILLAVALIHGRKYFHAGRVMYVGERLASQGKYAEAVPLLKEADEIAPQSDKASLLLANAALHIGDFPTAQKAFKAHDGGHYETSDEFRKVLDLWNRATDAIEKTDKAYELAKQPLKAEEAEALMRRAAAESGEERQPARDRQPPAGGSTLRAQLCARRLGGPRVRDCGADSWPHRYFQSAGPSLSCDSLSELIPVDQTSAASRS